MRTQQRPDRPAFIPLKNKFRRPQTDDPMECDSLRRGHKTESSRTATHSERKHFPDRSTTEKSARAVPHPKGELRENLRQAAASKRDSGKACPSPRTSALNTFHTKRTAPQQRPDRPAFIPLKNKLRRPQTDDPMEYDSLRRGTTPRVAALPRIRKGNIFLTVRRRRKFSAEPHPKGDSVRMYARPRRPNGILARPVPHLGRRHLILFARKGPRRNSFFEPML